MKDRPTDDGQLLTGEPRRLLTELFESALQKTEGVSAVHFRAQHDEYLGLLEEMIAVGWIENRQQTRTYAVALVGVTELSPTNAKAADLTTLCARLFNELRALYKREPEKKLLVTEVANLAGASEGRARQAISYLSEAGLFAGVSTNLNGVDAHVVLSEALIRKKSFEDVIEERRGWVRQHMRNRRRSIMALAEANRSAGSVPEGEMPASTDRPRSFQTPFETYTAVRQLGQGGSGFVWLAQDEDGNEVAIKYLDPAKLTSDSGRRFRNELLFCLRSSHRNVLQVKDLGEVNVGGKLTLFYVMPRYDSMLRDAMKNRLSSTDALAIFGKMLDGVEAAHSQGVWHRDLKPENILLSIDLADVRVADFGIAHFEQPDLYADANTKAGDRLANYRYAAPEQRDPKADKDHRADIFALGLMLNEMFTGEVPQGTSYRKIGDTAPESAYLDRVVERMIRQRPGERPDSIAEVLDLLHESNPSTRRSQTESSTVFFSKRFAEAFPGFIYSKIPESPPSGWKFC